MQLPIRDMDSSGDEWTAVTAVDEDIKLDIRPLDTKHGLLIKVQPQREPKDKPADYHVPVDIVLVIDVSGSMQSEAPAPAETGQVGERLGLSVLDLVKHASLTVLETLGEGDRLGIVTFSRAVKVLQPLTFMNPANNEKSAKLLRGLQVDSSTNMWQGVCQGLELFRKGKYETGAHRVPALMLLTDGMPNYMCPPQGWVSKLKSMGPLPAQIQSFGFGYDIRSGLLKSVSDLSGGQYAFIPDPGMIGTVFIHAVANLQSTSATEVCLVVRSKSLQLHSPLRSTVRSGETPISERDPSSGDNTYRLQITLGSIRFGQSRDLYLVYSRSPPSDCVIEAELTFRDHSGKQRQVTAVQRRALDFATVPAAEVAYHLSRTQICGFLSDFFPINPVSGEYRADFDKAAVTLEQLKKAVAARDFPYDEDCASLLADLEGPSPQGQISLALGRADYIKRWGGHYLLSLLDAHMNSACNSFKDPGPLRYGHDSPMFKRCRDALDAAFDTIEPPEPSLLAARMQSRSAFGNSLGAHSPASNGPVTSVFGCVSSSSSSLFGAPANKGPSTTSTSRMKTRSNASFSSHFNLSSNPCFSGSTMVGLAASEDDVDGGVVPISWLKAGMLVATPLGPRAVQAVLKTSVRNEAMIRLPGGVLVTPWHPVKMAGGDTPWAFPVGLSSPTTTTITTTTYSYSGFTYSLLLDHKDPSDGEDLAVQHAFRVGSCGMWGVALGHGVVKGDDVRAHAFFGDRDACIRALAMLPASHDGVATSVGVTRSAATGRVTGFRALDDGGRQQRDRGVPKVAVGLCGVEATA